ncbi:MAG: hypothetical protein Q8Q02_12735 [Nocardioides sp.]|nr:hypothetical protein [Nocardioides sp.]
MSEPRDPAEVRAEAARRRRLAEIFGDVLPSQTADDRERDPRDEEERGDEWLRRQVPPHHGAP